MIAHGLNPILNVSDIQQSFAWFGRGRADVARTFGRDGDDAADRHCLARGIEVTWPPTDRIGRGFEETE